MNRSGSSGNKQCARNRNKRWYGNLNVYDISQNEDDISFTFIVSLLE
jgi:hypothetical protein